MPRCAAAYRGSRAIADSNCSIAAFGRRTFQRNVPLRYRSYAATSEVGAAISGSSGMPSSGESFATIVRAISSCTSNTSCISRSYRSDQMWYPFATSTSCAVIRRRWPA
jgi:hypothetical protein